MSESIFSPVWYRVAALKPTLRSHVELHRHDYRGLIWYVLEDKSSARHHRFSTSAYQMIGLMDGQRSVEQIWDAVNVKLGDYAPTQDEVVRLLGQLHAADLLQSGVPPDSEELFARHQQRKASNLKKMFGNPLSQKFPLWDPDAFLDRCLPWLRWIFHPATGLVWVVTVLLGALLAGLYWTEFTSNVALYSQSPYNLLILCLIYPAIKLLHELGHAFAAKVEGGEVHEMGVMFMVFVPIPYVNASTSTAFRSKHKRMLVAAMGIAVELFLAAAAFFLWLSVENGLVREILLSVILIGGVSSLFFNGNPLLRYDGYYVLSDALEIPNLAQRSTQYLKFLCQYHLFGLHDFVSPATAPGEARWFVGYGIASNVYRLAVMWVIIVFVTQQLFVVGLLLAFWMLAIQVVLPIVKAIKYIATNPALDRQRTRALCTVAGLMASVLSVILVIPFPSFTMAQGIVQPPEEAHLRAGASGFIRQLMAEPNSKVGMESPIIQLEDPILRVRIKNLESKLKGLEAQYQAEWMKDQVQAEIVREEIDAVSADLENARGQERETLIRSRIAGKLLIPAATDQIGRFVDQGELIGYVIDDSKPTVRVAVTQSDIGRMRERIESVELRLADRLDQVLPAHLLRGAPEATSQLWSPALASNGGGSIAVDPTDPEGLTTVEKIFQFELEFTPQTDSVSVGTRVYVRFDHGHETLAHQWYRRLRQLFLRQFNV